MFWKWQHFGEEHATDDDDDSGDGENAVLDLVLEILVLCFSQFSLAFFAVQYLSFLRVCNCVCE